MGYTKIDLTSNKLVMRGAQFLPVGGTIATLSSLYPMNDIPFGTEIFVHNAKYQNYDIITYIPEAYDDVSDDFIPGWANAYEEIFNDPVSLGAGFWAQSPNGYPLYQIGEVASNDWIKITIPAGLLTMVTNPFPSSANPNNVSVVNWDVNIPYGTEIMFYNGASYDIYRYIDEAYDYISDDFIPGWANAYEDFVNTDIIKCAESFWVLSTKEIDVVFNNPIK